MGELRGATGVLNGPFSAVEGAETSAGRMKLGGSEDRNVNSG